MNRPLPSSLATKPPAWGVAVAALLTLVLPGCSSEEAIRSYRVPKQLASRSESAQPQEMLATIAYQDSPWAFKLMDAPEKVAQYREDFRRLVDSLSFGPDGQPSWELPEQWREEEGNQFVYRAFRPNADNKVRVTLSQLSLPFEPSQLNQSKWQDYVAINVNRWRNQLQLGDQSWDEMAGELERIEKLSKPDAPAYYVTLRGNADSGSIGMGGPFSGGASMPAGPASTNSPTQPSPTSPSPAARAKESLVVKLPEGWQEVPPLNIMAMRSYEVTGEGDQKAAITFIAAGGDRESNVARWNSQVQGDPAQVPQALENCEKLTVHGAATEVYQLVGSGDNPQAISVAKIDWSSQDALFVKMMGPAKIVQAQHTAFVNMVKELTW